jgi:hypothetical protein
MGQLTGVVTITVNGARQQSDDGAKLNMGGVERTPQSVYGYTEKKVMSQVDFTLFHDPSVKLSDIGAWKKVTVRFECDSGPVYTIANAFTLKPPELTGGDAKVAVTMQGDPAIEE